MLPRDGGHEIYWEESGDANGTPAIFLHGGPGAGTSTMHRRFFDPRRYRIVLMDQRGCGRSTPFGAVEANDTPRLVADIDALRGHLEIDRWLVFGGSWGSTLALTYAQAHPDRVSALVLRGIFLGTRAEIDWFLYGIKRIFPEAWRRFAEFLPAAERGDLLTHYWARLADPDPAVHLPAARRWAGYETACSTLLPRGLGDAGRKRDEPSPGDRWALGLARLEAHFFRHDMFLADRPIVDRIDRVRDIPAAIVHGRYDIICPIETADRLAGLWPEARYVVVPNAGHSALEPGISTELVKATDAFAG